MRARSRHPLLVLLLLLAAACGPAPATEATATAGAAATAGATATATPAETPAEAPAGSDPAVAGAAVPRGDVLRAVEVGRRPHDPSAFTQGLEFHDGRLFESRGLYADREDVVLAEIDPADGSTVRQVDRPAGDDAFHEGLTVVGDRIIQLTWQDGIAKVYDRDTFEPVGQLAYEGEGWGICDEPDRLLMTDTEAGLERA